MKRRYSFKLYPTAEQASALHVQRMMIADLWNALLDRHETIQRRTIQRQVWIDSQGKRHSGRSVHCTSWQTVRYKNGQQDVMEPSRDGLPKAYTDFDMQNEITHMLNVLPEWRELSVWSAHRTANALSNAFKAFYRRAKQGAGQQSGYPRFKRRDRATSIPHRFASGCKLTEGAHRLSWCLRLKGVVGEIHARGRFPRPPGTYDHKDVSGPVTDWTHADIIWQDQNWWLSVAVDLPERRQAGRHPTRIEFDLLDCFALINGLPNHPDELHEVRVLMDQLDEMKRNRDLEFPRNKRRSKDRDIQFYSANLEIAGRSAYLARVRRNSLHVWTARLVEQASDITVIAPNLRNEIKTPHGDQQQWGAQTDVVSKLNRHVLGFAPSMAIAMLVYKAEEAGIRCDVVEAELPKIVVGQHLVQAAKIVRRLRHQTKREKAA